MYIITVLRHLLTRHWRPMVGLFIWQRICIRPEQHWTVQVMHQRQDTRDMIPSIVLCLQKQQTVWRPLLIQHSVWMQHLLIIWKRIRMRMPLLIICWRMLREIQSAVIRWMRISISQETESIRICSVEILRTSRIRQILFMWQNLQTAERPGQSRHFWM